MYYCDYRDKFGKCLSTNYYGLWPVVVSTLLQYVASWQVQSILVQYAMISAYMYQLDELP